MTGLKYPDKSLLINESGNYLLQLKNSPTPGSCTAVMMMEAAVDTGLVEEAVDSELVEEVVDTGLVEEVVDTGLVEADSLKLLNQCSW